MTPETKSKLNAGTNIALGAGRCVSGILLLCGHGLLAAFIKKPIAQHQIGFGLLKSGSEKFKKGCEEWEKCRH